MKKQFRLYDIYRNVAIGYKSDIKGIRNYDVIVYDTIDYIDVRVMFDDYEIFKDLITMDVDVEAKLKEFVKQVNKKLKNCKKPGPKPHQEPKK